MSKNLKRVLIANRGEISARISRTLQKMGKTAVAVHAVGEETALHTRTAHESVTLPGKGVASYLDIAAILRAAKEAHCDAVHPGYGFLAENSAFAAACEKAGFVFIGPTSRNIAELGDKGAAKRLAMKSGVPVVDFVNEAEVGSGAFEAESLKLKLPVLLKPLAGGGGKGMVLVRTKAEFPEAVRKARSEAERAFGDGRLLVERFLEKTRHVEVQVFCDQQGNAAHLFERDCTYQRRYQKVVEESPSASISDALRSRLLEGATKLVHAAGYQNLGTVEFIVDEGDQPAFMEVNTRLQVEHPVTEAVTGMDLVELQIRLAEGESVKALSKKVKSQGHAIQVRVYAEDPEQNFLPSAGKILKLRLPTFSWLRVDSGVEEGTVVHPEFDPLMLKLIVHGNDRDEAIRRMREALRSTVLLGVGHNIDHLQWLLAQEVFGKSVHTTRWIDENHEDFLEQSLSMDVKSMVAAATYLDETRRLKGEDLDDEGWAGNPWETLGAWRLGGHR